MELADLAVWLLLALVFAWVAMVLLGTWRTVEAERRELRRGERRGERR